MELETTSETKEIEVVLSNTPKFISHAEESDNFCMTREEARKLRGLSKRYVRNTDYAVKSGYKGKDGAEAKFISLETQWGYTYLDCMLPPYNIDYLTQLYEISPAHHAAVNAKVESVFGLGWDWIESPAVKQKRDATRTASGSAAIDKAVTKVRVAMEQWLIDINNLDVFDEILKKVGIDYETTGNGYLEIGRTTSGAVGYIGHIPSKYVRVRRQRDGFVQIIGRDVRFFKNFGDKETISPITDDDSPNEIIHLRKYSPTNLYYGVPDIIAAKSALGGNEFASRYNLDYFENKAVPRHIITLKNASLAPGQISKLVEFFETGLRGQHHRSIFVPLGTNSGTGKDMSPELEFKSIEDGQQDFSFGEYRQANNEEIFMSHRLPASRAGVQADNVSLSASRDADKVFKESYSKPEQTIFEKKMAKIISEITDMVIFQLNELSLVDADTQSKINERDVRNQIKVPNEVRRDGGLGDRPDGKGNEPWVANAQQAADQNATTAKSRTRDSQRSAAASNGASGTGTRAAAGDGKSTA